MAVGNDGAVTVLSDSARELLDLPGDSRGPAAGRPATWRRSVRDVLLGDYDVRDAGADGGRPGAWCSTATGSIQDGRQVGTVTTLRDRTELLAMQSELSARESVTETLRAQTHEFSQPAAHDLRPARSSRSTTRPGA